MMARFMGCFNVKRSNTQVCDDQSGSTKLSAQKEKHVSFPRVADEDAATQQLAAQLGQVLQLRPQLSPRVQPVFSPGILAIQSAAGMVSVPGACEPSPTVAGLQSPLFSSGYMDEPIQKAILAGCKGGPPVVSLESLQAAFRSSQHAIAVVRVVTGASNTSSNNTSATGQQADGSEAAEAAEFAAEHCRSDAGGAGRLFGSASSRAGSISLAMRGLQEDSLFAELRTAASKWMEDSEVGTPVQLLSPAQATAPPGAASSNGSPAEVAQLDPVYLNRALKSMLDVRNHEEYTFTMDKQLSRNPMLVMLFENCVQQLLRGRCSSVRQYTPLFSSPNSVHPSAQATFIHLQINTCLFLDPSGAPAPALFLWFNAPSSQFDLISQLKRNYLALETVPSMVTIFAMDGRVLHQNSGSVAYMGFAMGNRSNSSAGSSLSDANHSLQQLLVLEPAAIDDMLTALGEGKTWQALLRMPPQLDLTEPCTGLQASTFESWQMPAESDEEGGTQCSASPVGTGGTIQQQQQQQAHLGSGGAAGVVASSVMDEQQHPQSQQQQQQSGQLQWAGSNSSTPAPAVLRRVANSNWDKGRASLDVQLNDSRAIQMLTGSHNMLATGGSPGKGASGCCVNIGNNSSSRRPAMISTCTSLTGAKSGRFGCDPFGLLSMPSSPCVGLARSMSGCTEAHRWHSVQATKFSDPVTGEDVIMLVQTDVTERVAAERQLQQVLNAEHKLLEGIFPRQVLQSLTKAAIRHHIGSCSGSRVSSACGHRGRSRVSLTGGGNRIKLALQHEQVTVLFADIVNFTNMSKSVEPGVVMDFLNDLYTIFDEHLEEAGVYKVETIGDCYMVAGGLIFTDAQGFKTVLQSKVDPLHAQRTFAFALSMLAAASRVIMPDSGLPVQLRVGIHSGPVVSGVVGTRMPRFCLFGDTVNTASRMESSNARPGCVHVSADTHALIGGSFWQTSGPMEVKGKGLMETYYFDPAAEGDTAAQQQVEQLLKQVREQPTQQL